MNIIYLRLSSHVYVYTLYNFDLSKKCINILRFKCIYHTVMKGVFLQKPDIVYITIIFKLANYLTPRLLGVYSANST